MSRRLVYEGEVTDKRQHPRKSLRLSVVYVDASGARHEAMCIDLSLGGAFIETLTPLEFGAKLEMELQLPGLEKPARVDATVRWTKPSGMGVQLGFLGARETHALVELLR